MSAKWPLTAAAAAMAGDLALLETTAEWDKIMNAESAGGVEIGKALKEDLDNSIFGDYLKEKLKLIFDPESVWESFSGLKALCESMGDQGNFECAQNIGILDGRQRSLIEGLKNPEANPYKGEGYDDSAGQR